MSVEDDVITMIMPEIKSKFMPESMSMTTLESKYMTMAESVSPPEPATQPGSNFGPATQPALVSKTRGPVQVRSQNLFLFQFQSASTYLVQFQTLGLPPTLPCFSTLLCWVHHSPFLLSCQFHCTLRPQGTSPPHPLLLPPLQPLSSGRYSLEGVLSQI